MSPLSGHTDVRVVANGFRCVANGVSSAGLVKVTHAVRAQGVV